MFGQYRGFAMVDRTRFGVAVTTDTVLHTMREGRLCLLLVRRGSPPFEGLWALPGGFLEADEDLNAGARRELQEETGVSNVPLEQFGAFGKPDRDPRGRVVSIAYSGVMSQNGLREPPRAATDAADAAWFDADDLPPLAFDHAGIVARARHHLRASLACDPRVAFAFLPASGFTLADLQQVYEAVRGEALDRRGFRSWVGTLDLLEETGTRTAAPRPAKLYRPGAARDEGAVTPPETMEAPGS